MRFLIRSFSSLVAVGEGHHEDLLDQHAGLQDQAQDEPCDGIGLSGSGARFDEVRALEGGLEKVELLHFAYCILCVLGAFAVS